jgi:hypothetical protein
MAQWGKTDDAANSVLWGVSGFNKTANSVNRDAFFGNTTVNAYVNGITVGQFGVDTTEMGISNGSVVEFTLTFAGSGYSANAAVTVSGNATANAERFANGRINLINVTANGSGYTTNPTVTIDAPTAQSFNASSAVDGTDDFITVSANPFINNDIVTYLVAAGNTALTNLANASTYYVVSANSTGVKLSNAFNGSAIDLTAGTSETGHSLTGQRATAVAVINGAANKGFHAGWVVRKVGTGGRAGRVQHETLVAMGTITSDGDGSIIKDS